MPNIHLVLRSFRSLTFLSRILSILDSLLNAGIESRNETPSGAFVLQIIVKPGLMRFEYGHAAQF